MPSKYQKIASDLRDQILLSKSITPIKLPTEQELCIRYGVSRQTVRQALLTLEDENLISRRQGSGAYTIPRPEHLHQKKIVLMISEENEYTYPGFISDLRSILRTQGFVLSVLITQNDINIERNLLSGLLDRPADILLTEAIRSAFPNPNIDLYEKIQLSGTKIIFINHAYPEAARTFFVRSDDSEGGYLAGEYLITNGLKKPCAILPDFSQNAKLRYHGLQAAYRNHLLPMPSDDIYWYSKKNIQSLRKKQDTGFLTDFIRSFTQEYDCIVCYSDEIAYSLIRELSYAGYSVPGRISVISFDNSYLCSLSQPPISSLGLSPHEPGYTLGQMVLDILHEKEIQNKTLPWKLFPRGSVISLHSNYF